MTITELQTAIDTNFTPTGADKITAAELRTVMGNIKDELLARGITIVADTTALAALSGANYKAAIVESNGVFKWLNSGTANGTTIFAAAGGGTWNRVIAVSGGGASAINDLTDVTITSPTTGQVLKWNGTQWVNDTDETGGGGSSQSLNDVTTVGNFTNNELRTGSGGFSVMNTTNTTNLGSFYNVGNNTSELYIPQPSTGKATTYSYDFLQWTRSGFSSQTLKPFPTPVAAVTFTFPNTASNHYLPTTFKLNGTTVAASDTGLVDLGTISGSNIYNTSDSLTSNRFLDLGTSNTLSFVKGASTYWHLFNNGNLWLGNGTPTNNGDKLNVNGTMQITNYPLRIANGIAITRTTMPKTLDVNSIVIGTQTSSGLLGAGDILIGLQAGTSLNSANGNNVFIGREAGGTIVTGRKNIFIGSYVGSSAYMPMNTNSDYKLLIGNVTSAGGGAVIGGDMINGQVFINPTSADMLTPDPSIAFGINPLETGFGTSTTYKGFLPPRMTKTQRNAISSPAAGLMVIVTGETGGEYLSYYNANQTRWEKVNTTAD